MSNLTEEPVIVKVKGKLDLTNIKSQKKLDALKAELENYNKEGILDRPLDLLEYGKLTAAVADAEVRLPYVDQSDDELAAKIAESERLVEDARLEYQRLVLERGDDALRTQDAMAAFQESMAALEGLKNEEYTRGQYKLAEQINYQAAIEAAAEKMRAIDAKTLEDMREQGAEEWQIEVKETTLSKTPLEQRPEAQKLINEALEVVTAQFNDRLLERASKSGTVKADLLTKRDLQNLSPETLRDKEALAKVKSQYIPAIPGPYSDGEGEGDGGEE